MRIAEPARDDVLLRRAAKGEEEAFTLLYRRHQAAMYRFSLRMTGSAWAAEEIVQDVFMTLMRAPKKYDSSRGTLGGNARADEAGSRCSAGIAGGVSRSGGAVRTGRVELRRSGASGRMSDRDDSIAAASRARAAAGEARDVARRAAARERGAMTKRNGSAR